MIQLAYKMSLCALTMVAFTLRRLSSHPMFDVSAVLLWIWRPGVYLKSRWSSLPFGRWRCWVLISVRNGSSSHMMPRGRWLHRHTLKARTNASLSQAFSFIWAATRRYLHIQGGLPTSIKQIQKHPSWVCQIPHLLVDPHQAKMTTKINHHRWL